MFFLGHEGCAPATCHSYTTVQQGQAVSRAAQARVAKTTVGHSSCLLLGDHPPVPDGQFEVLVCPGSGLRGTQSCSISVTSLGLHQSKCEWAGGWISEKSPLQGQTACLHLPDCLPGKVWPWLVWLLLRCPTLQMRGRLPEDPTLPGFHGECLLVEEGAVWKAARPWKHC